MHDDSSTFGLNRDKLAKIWTLGEDAPEGKPSGDEELNKAELLQHQLAESLPLEAGMARMLPDILAVVCEKLRPFTGCSFGALLVDSETDLLVVETIKDLHKKQAGDTAAGPLQEVATAIYYGAIASALVHHDIKITKLSYGSLKQSFERLTSGDWLSSDLRTLLSAAQEICVRRLDKSGQ